MEFYLYLSDFELKYYMKDLYGSAILFFYFFKWPYFLGFPYLYMNGLNHNFILDGLWFFSIFLILKDIYTMIKKRQKNKKEP